MTTAKTAKKEVFIELPRENCHLVFIGGWGGGGGGGGQWGGRRRGGGGGGVNRWWEVYWGRFLQVGR